MREFKVGDTVEVTYSGSESHVAPFNGAIGVITDTAIRYDWSVEFPESDHTGYAFYTNELTLVKPFTKSDLRTGMVVVLRNGEHMFVAMDSTSQDSEGCQGGLLLRNGGWVPLKDYTEDLNVSYTREYDIMEVYSVFANDMLTLVRGHLPLNRELLYKREEVVVVPKVKMTQADIEEVLGYEIEVVSMGEEG